MPESYLVVEVWADGGGWVPESKPYLQLLEVGALPEDGKRRRVRLVRHETAPARAPLAQIDRAQMDRANLHVLTRAVCDLLELIPDLQFANRHGIISHAVTNVTRARAIRERLEGFRARGDASV